MKRFLITLMALLLLVCCAGCAGKASSPMLSYNATTESAAYDMASAEEYGLASPAEPAASAAPAMPMPAEAAAPAGQNSRGNAEAMYGGHKIISTYTFEISTDAFEAHYAALTAKVKELGGYLQSSSVSGTKPETYGQSGRYANISARVPTERAEEFVSYTGSTGTVTYQDCQTQDVTLEYYDSETRLGVLRTQLDRLKSILVETDNLADVIALESEIADVTTEIEQMTSELRKYDDLIDYTTVYINLQEERLLQGPAASKTMGERISAGFRENLGGIGVGFENFIVWLISSLPALLLAAVIFGGIFLIVRGVIRRNKKKKENGNV